MYRAKRTQSRLEFFSPELEEEAPRRLVLVTALKRAIDVRSITLHYQPKVELARGRVVGVEALARWTDPVLGQVGPSTFVPLAERTGLAEPLTSLAFQIAAADCRRWQEQGCFVPVAVNVSARALVDPRLPELVDDQRRAFGLGDDAIEIEITESTLMGVTCRRARRSASAGDRHPHLDRRLRHRLLVALLPARAPRARAEDRPVLHHGPHRRAGLRRSCVRPSSWPATSGSRSWLRVWRVTLGERVTLGCDYVQGFAIVRPMPADAMLRWLRAYVPST